MNKGEVQFGTWINMIRNPAILSLLKAAGLDFARIDMEHSPPSMETIADMAIVSRALDFPIFVRPPEANREWITRLLDCGIWNLHCAQVDSAAQAAEIVDATRFPPIGSRGAGPAGPQTDFEMAGSSRERQQFANDQVFVTVLLESVSAFDDLDDIAAMPGIDAITVGAGDLARDLGLTGADRDKAVAEYRQRIFEAAKKHGKTCSMSISSAEQAREFAKAGALLLGYSYDIAVIHDAYRHIVAEMKPPAM